MPGRSPHAKVIAGEKFRFPAQLYNDIIELVKQKLPEIFGGDGQEWDNETSTRIRIKNTTATNLPRFAILKLDDVITHVGSNEKEFKNRNAFNGIAPTDSAPFVVALEPLPDGAIGNAVTMGQVKARVDLTDVDHRYANSIAGDTGKLVSGETGYARIEWTDSYFVDTGEQWAVITVLGKSTLSGLAVDDTEHDPSEYVSNVSLLTFAPSESALITDEGGGNAQVRYLNAGPLVPGLLSVAPGFGEPYNGADPLRVKSLYQLATGTHVFGGLYNGGGSFNTGVTTACIGSLMVTDEAAVIPSSGFPDDADYVSILGDGTYNNFKLRNASGTLTARMEGVSGANIVQLLTVVATSTGGQVIWGAGGSGGQFSFDRFDIYSDRVWLQTVSGLTDFRSIGTGWLGGPNTGSVPLSSLSDEGVFFSGAWGGFLQLDNGAGGICGFAVEGTSVYVKGGSVSHSGEPTFNLLGALHLHLVYGDNLTSINVQTPSFNELGQDIIVSGTPYVLRGIVVSSTLPPIDISGGGVYPITGTLPVTNGGTGAGSFTSGQLLAGNGTSALDSLTSTRVSGETLELKLASDRWVAFGIDSF